MAKPATLTTVGLLTITLAASLQALPAASAGTTTQPASTLQWSACPGAHPSQDEQCTTVNVPTNYDDPSAGTTPITVSRVRPSSGNTQGVLVVNRGSSGGGSHKDVSTMRNDVDPQVADSFDLIAIDQRGVTHDSTNRCYATEENRFNPPRFFGQHPHTKAEKRTYLDGAQSFADNCKENLSPELLTVNSETHARDLNEVRKALGEDTLNILATDGQDFTAQTYVQLFPETVRAVAIDGLTDGRKTQGNWWTARQSLAQRTGEVAAHEATWKHLMAECDKVGPTKCGIAQEDTPGAAEQTVLKTLKALDEGQLQITRVLRYVKPDGTVVAEETDEPTWTKADALAAINDATYNPGFSLNTTVHFFQVFSKAAAGDTKVVIDRRAEMHGELIPTATTTQNTSQAANQAAGLPPLASYDSSQDFRLITQCNNSMFVPGLRRGQWIADRSARRSPIFGPSLAWDTVYCNGWHNPMARTKLAFNADTEHPMLVVNKRFSPEANYGFAKAATSRYGNAFFLTDEDYGSRSHVVSSCAMDAISEYLMTAKAPTKNTCDSRTPLFINDSLTEVG